MRYHIYFLDGAPEKEGGHDDERSRQGLFSPG